MQHIPNVSDLLEEEELGRRISELIRSCESLIKMKEGKMFQFVVKYKQEFLDKGYKISISDYHDEDNNETYKELMIEYVKNDSYSYAEFLHQKYTDLFWSNVNDEQIQLNNRYEFSTSFVGFITWLKYNTSNLNKLRFRIHVNYTLTGPSYETARIEWNGKILRSDLTRTLAPIEPIKPIVPSRIQTKIQTNIHNGSGIQFNTMGYITD